MDRYEEHKPILWNKATPKRPKQKVSFDIMKEGRSNNFCAPIIAFLDDGRAICANCEAEYTNMAIGEKMFKALKDFDTGSNALTLLKFPL